MGHDSVRDSHRKMFGAESGSGICPACGDGQGLIRKGGMTTCRQCFGNHAKDIGFVKEWLEEFSQKLMERADIVSDEVQNVVEEMGAVELDLQNTFNSFRCLSSTQFVENRVYEEDETESVLVETPMKVAQLPLIPTESYDDEIFLRYKDAVTMAWAAFQQGSGQWDQASQRIIAQRKVMRHSLYNGRPHILPYVVGTDEFAQDVHCGLADLRQGYTSADDSEIDTDVERDGADLAAELIGTGDLSEGEWSESESDGTGNQEGAFEPSVSAALDFKAMLEAALRNPSMPYDGGTLDSADGMYGQYGDPEFSLPNVGIDNFRDFSRTISRRMESEDHVVGNNRAQILTANVQPNEQHAVDHLEAEVSKCSTEVMESVGSVRSFQSGQDVHTQQSTLEDILKDSLNSQVQTLVDGENRLGIGAGHIQAGSSGLAHIASGPGGLFDDDESDAGYVSGELAVISVSSTGPTLPDGIFQRQPSSSAADREPVSQISNFSKSNLLKSSSYGSLFNAGQQVSNQDMPSLVKDLEVKRSETMEPRMLASSIGPVQMKERLLEAGFANGSKINVPSSVVGLRQIRGGLFDDSDDDDEDTGNLVATSDVGARTWTSHSSKGLFDSLEDSDAIQVGNSLSNPKADEVGKNNSSNSPSPALNGQQIKQDKHLAQRQHSGCLPSSTETFQVDPGSSETTQADAPEEKHESEENFKLMQSHIQSVLAAVMRPTMLSAVETDDDSDSWSSSGSEGDVESVGKVDLEPSMRGFRALESLETKTSLITAVQDGTIQGESQEKSVSSTSSGGFSSSELPMDQIVHLSINDGVEEQNVQSFQDALEVPAAHFRRSLSASQASEKAELHLFKSPSLQPNKVDLHHGSQEQGSSEQTQSGSDVRSLVHTTMSRPLGPPNRRGPLVTKATPILQDGPSLGSQSSSAFNDGIPESAMQKRRESSPLKDTGLMTGGRPFTSLFDDDDDGDEDIFGHFLPKNQDSLRVGQPQEESWPSSNSTLSFLMRSSTDMEAKSPQKNLSLIRQVSTPSSTSIDSSGTSSLMQDSRRSISTISTLLFGDDDDDNEDALFGPLHGRAVKSSDWRKSASGMFRTADASEQKSGTFPLDE